MNFPHRLLVAVLLLAPACSQEAPPPAPEPAPAPAPEPPPAPAPAAEATDTLLVPSPGQVQKALADAGITAKVEELVKKASVSTKASSKDETAVRLGVLLANTVLTAKQASRDDTLARLAEAKAGFEALGAGKDIPVTIDDLSVRLKNDAVNSDDLVVELDDLARTLVPEVTYEAGPRSVPLIQAGMWLAGSHYVAGALVDTQKTDQATPLLKQPEVVAYFLRYLKGEGAEVAPGPILVKLQEALVTLQTAAAKDALTPEDVQSVQTTTGDILGML